jgi:hypothetical protein
MRQILPDPNRKPEENQPVMLVILHVTTVHFFKELPILLTTHSTRQIVDDATVPSTVVVPHFIS